MKNLIPSPLPLLLLAMLIINSCSKDETSDPPQTIRKSLTGTVQKGPFVSGSAITVYDLLADLSPTGKSFNTQINDNGGTFVINNIPLSSSFVNLRADGFYYNEVTGVQSSSQITLYSISELSAEGNINVNLLTHLEKPRVEYLISQGKSFAEAKQLAQSEVLQIFNISTESMPFSEYLDISKSGEANAILLAVSSILQGFRTESELTSLVSGIRNDITTDGVLSSSVLGSSLINHAVSLDTVTIRQNLIKRYEELGLPMVTGDFGNHISHFILSTAYVVTGTVIEYPLRGVGNENILSINDTAYWGGGKSITAKLPKGTSLKVTIQPVNGAAMPMYQLGTNHNWKVSSSSTIATLTAIEADNYCDVSIALSAGKYVIQYFESSSATPSRTKTIRII